MSKKNKMEISKKIVIIVMGVSGSGKTTIGELVAQGLKLPYYDADDFHPLANVEKMSQGFPLNDADRLPWLQLLAEQLEKWELESGAVLACSALKAHYRELLASKTTIQWVYLSGTYELIKSRMEQRSKHFMKADLLQSQFETLEVPTYGIHVPIDKKPEDIVTHIISKLNTDE